MMTVSGGKSVPVLIPSCRTRGHAGSPGCLHPSKAAMDSVIHGKHTEPSKDPVHLTPVGGTKGRCLALRGHPSLCLLQPPLSGWHPEPQPKQDGGGDWPRGHREGTSGPSLLDEPSIKPDTWAAALGSGGRGSDPHLLWSQLREHGLTPHIVLWGFHGPWGQAGAMLAGDLEGVGGPTRKNSPWKACLWRFIHTYNEL